MMRWFAAAAVFLLMALIGHLAVLNAIPSRIMAMVHLKMAERGVPMVTMATAHPAKFPDAVERATGVRPQLPEHLADLLSRPERTKVLPNDLSKIESYIDSL